MLRLWQYSIKSPDSASSRDYATMLPGAVDVCVSRSLDGDYTLSFKIAKGVTDRMEVRQLVEYEGQLFRIVRITDADNILSVSCEHIFIHDAKHFFLPSVAQGDCIGEDAYTVIDECVYGTDFVALSEKQCEALGMKRIRINIDFETVDKVTLYDVITQVIECAGIGELYVDNNRFAIVERIGKDTDTVISTAVNMVQCSVETDTTELVTRLYPYGRDNLEITNAAANESGADYIDSENYNLYGSFCACIDYGDCTDPDSLLSRAMWNFDPANPDRIDVPGVSVSGQVMGCDAEVGDRVNVVYDGNIIGARIISLARYPYEDTPDTVTIGRRKKDMYFYLNQVGAIARKYAAVSVNNGKIRGSAISGTVQSSGLKLLSATLTADKEGNMYINGKKVLVE